MASELLLHIVMKDLREVVQLDITKVQVKVEVKPGGRVMVLQLGSRQAVDDQIYKLHHICIAPSSHNRSTLSHPVISKIHVWSKPLP